MFNNRKGKWLGALTLTALLLAACSDKADDTATKDADPEPVAETEAVQSIIVQGDTINSHFQKDAVCVVDSRFERGHSLVFRANVIDQTTGETVEGAKVKVLLGNGEEYEMKMGPHGEENTTLWTVLWTIPDDFPTGTLDYKLVAEVDGEEYNYEPFNVSLSKLTILEKGAEAQATAAAQEATDGGGSSESAENEGEA